MGDKCSGSSRNIHPPRVGNVPVLSCPYQSGAIADTQLTLLDSNRQLAISLIVIPAWSGLLSYSHNHPAENGWIFWKVTILWQIYTHFFTKPWLIPRKVVDGKRTRLERSTFQNDWDEDNRIQQQHLSKTLTDRENGILANQIGYRDTS